MVMIGRTVPLPAPGALVDAIAKVQVTNSAESGDGFQLTLSLGKENIADYALMKSGLLDPPARVIIAVRLGVKLEVLIDGVILHHQLAPGKEGGAATLTVTGKSLAAMMDMKEVNKAYPNQSDSVIVTQVIARHAKYGLIPAVTATTNVPLMTDKVPHQHETDLKFIERLASANGFVFHIEPVALMTNKAYWGPEKRAGAVQHALTTNMGSRDNVTSLSFTNDALAPIGTSGSIMEPRIKRAIPIPRLPSLKIPPLSAKPAQALRTTIARETANKKPGEGATSVVAAMTGAPDAVTATGELDSARYGHVLRARRLVGVRGVGLTYNGLYYVTSVTHAIERGSYKQSFTLKREGTRSTLPVVRP